MNGGEEGETLRFRSKEQMSDTQVVVRQQGYGALATALRKHVYPGNHDMTVEDLDQCSSNAGFLNVKIGSVERMGTKSILSDMWEAGFHGVDYVIESGTSGLVTGVFRIPLVRNPPSLCTIDATSPERVHPMACFCVFVVRLALYMALVLILTLGLLYCVPVSYNSASSAMGGGGGGGYQEPEPLQTVMTAQMPETPQRPNSDVVDEDGWITVTPKVAVFEEAA